MQLIFSLNTSTNILLFKRFIYAFCQELAVAMTKQCVYNYLCVSPMQTDRTPGAFWGFIT